MLAVGDGGAQLGSIAKFVAGAILLAPDPQLRAASGLRQGASPPQGRKPILVVLDLTERIG